MPNNNPAGHNQHTKRKDQIAQSGTSSDVTGAQTDHDADHDAGHEGTRSPGESAGASAPAKRGFAAMDEATQRGIASKGGQSQGKENNPGNFANDRDRAREAGRKGGEAHGTHREAHSPTNPSTNH
jgi:general stress protein YciG